MLASLCMSSPRKTVSLVQVIQTSLLRVSRMRSWGTHVQRALVQLYTDMHMQSHPDERSPVFGFEIVQLLAPTAMDFGTSRME